MVIRYFSLTFTARNTWVFSAPTRLKRPSLGAFVTIYRAFNKVPSAFRAQVMDRANAWIGQRHRRAASWTAHSAQKVALMVTLLPHARSPE